MRHFDLMEVLFKREKMIATCHRGDAVVTECVEAAG